MARKVTEQLLEQVDGADFGYARHVLLCALKYMSEDDVADMAHANEFFLDEDEDEEDEDSEWDGQPDEAQEWYDFDPDC